MVVEGEEGGEDLLFGLGTEVGQGVGFVVDGWEGLAGAGGFEDFGPGGGPASVWIGGGVGVENGAVEGQVGEAEPGGAFVVEVGEGAFFEFGVLGGCRIDGGLADEALGLGAADFGNCSGDELMASPSMIHQPISSSKSIAACGFRSLNRLSKPAKYSRSVTSAPLSASKSRIHGVSHSSVTG